MSLLKGGEERPTIYVQRHLTLSSSDTFLIWTFPQVGNLSLWSLRIGLKHMQRTACRSAPEHVLLFRACDGNSRIFKLHVVQGSTMVEIARAKGSKSGKL